MFPPDCVCGSVSSRDQQLRVEAERIRAAFCSVVGIMQSMEGLNRIENRVTNGLLRRNVDSIFFLVCQDQGPQGFGICLELCLWLSSLLIKITSAYRPQSHASKSLIKKFFKKVYSLSPSLSYI